MTENTTEGNQEDDPVPRSRALEAAAQKRLDLKQALSKVEVAAASPSGHAGWRDDLATSMAGLRQALDDHIAEAESADGILPEIVSLAPRLSNQAKAVADEHPVLCRQTDRIIQALAGHPPVEDIRKEILGLLLAIAGHRQKGADLVYESYQVDIGGGG